MAVGGAPYTFEQFNGSIPVIDFFFKSINATYKGNYFVSNTDEIPYMRPEIKEELYAIVRIFKHKGLLHSKVEVLLGGKMIRFLTAGESHGNKLIGIIEGIPANLYLDIDYINKELKGDKWGLVGPIG